MVVCNFSIIGVKISLPVGERYFLDHLHASDLHHASDNNLCYSLTRYHNPDPKKQDDDDLVLLAQVS